MARLLFVYFKELVQAADNKVVGFSSYHDNLTDKYEMMDYAEQGKFHELVSEWMKS